MVAGWWIDSLMLTSGEGQPAPGINARAAALAPARARRAVRALRVLVRVNLPIITLSRLKVEG